MTNNIFYFDLYIGHAGQSPTAFLCIPLKMAALDWSDALDRAATLGFDRAQIMRLDKYSVKARNGATVVQYRREETYITDAYLLGSVEVHHRRSAAVKSDLKKRKGLETAVRRMPD